MIRGNFILLLFLIVFEGIANGFQTQIFQFNTGNNTINKHDTTEFSKNFYNKSSKIELKVTITYRNLIFNTSYTDPSSSVHISFRDNLVSTLTSSLTNRNLKIIRISIDNIRKGSVTADASVILVSTVGNFSGIRTNGTSENDVTVNITSKSTTLSSIESSSVSSSTSGTTSGTRMSESSTSKSAESTTGISSTDKTSATSSESPKPSSIQTTKSIESTSSTSQTSSVPVTETSIKSTSQPETSSISTGKTSERSTTLSSIESSSVSSSTSGTTSGTRMSESSTSKSSESTLGISSTDKTSATSSESPKPSSIQTTKSIESTSSTSQTSSVPVTDTSIKSTSQPETSSISTGKTSERSTTLSSIESSSVSSSTSGTTSGTRMSESSSASQFFTSSGIYFIFDFSANFKPSYSNSSSPEFRQLSLNYSYFINSRLNQFDFLSVFSWILSFRQGSVVVESNITVSSTNYTLVQQDTIRDILKINNSNIDVYPATVTYPTNSITVEIKITTKTETISETASTGKSSEMTSSTAPSGTSISQTSPTIVVETTKSSTGSLPMSSTSGTIETSPSQSSTPLSTGTSETGSTIKSSSVSEISSTASTGKSSEITSSTAPSGTSISQTSPTIVNETKSVIISSISGSINSRSLSSSSRVFSSVTPDFFTNSSQINQTQTISSFQLASTLSTPAAGRREFFLTFHIINMEFTRDYTDLNSELSLLLIRKISRILSFLPNFGYQLLSFSILQFTSGSIKANLKMELKGNSNDILQYDNVVSSFNQSISLSNSSLSISSIIPTYIQNDKLVSSSVSTWAYYVIGVCVFIVLVALIVMFCQLRRYKFGNRKLVFQDVEEGPSLSFERRMSMLRKLTSEEILREPCYRLEFDDSLPRSSDNNFRLEFDA